MLFHPKTKHPQDFEDLENLKKKIVEDKIRYLSGSKRDFLDSKILLISMVTKAIAIAKNRFVNCKILSA